MAKRKTRSSSKAFAIAEKHQIVTDKLPSNRDVLSVLFFNMKLHSGKNVRVSAKLTFSELVVFWEKAGIPIRDETRCIDKIVKLRQELKDLRKSTRRPSNIAKENAFYAKLDLLFDISHHNALKKLKSEISKQFLLAQRLPTRLGSLASLASELEKTSNSPKPAKQPKLSNVSDEVSMDWTVTEEGNEASTSTGDDDNESVRSWEAESETSNSNSEEMSESDSDYEATVEHGKKKKFINERIAGALDRCRVSSRNAVFIITAVVIALGHIVENLVISRNTIERKRKKYRKATAQRIGAEIRVI